MVKLERPPSMDGRHMVMIVVPNKQVLDRLEQAAGDARKERDKKGSSPAA